MVKQDPAIHARRASERKKKKLKIKFKKPRHNTTKIIDLMFLAELDTKTCWKTDS